MASHFRIQKPYELTSLPKTLDQTAETYVVGEVFGQAQASKKRKRPELAVGINGEALNIYDVCTLPTEEMLPAYVANCDCRPLRRDRSPRIPSPRKPPSAAHPSR